MDQYRSGLRFGAELSVRLLFVFSKALDARARLKTSWITVELRRRFRSGENGRKRADELDAKLRRGEIVGPLHGVPMTVKENNDVRGLVTTVGFEENIGRVASSDETMIERMKKAGVVIWGKTNLPVGAMNIQSYNDIYGSTSNPWDLERTPGGSSGGGACCRCSFD